VARRLVDRRLVARAGLALALANIRYWRTVAPIVRGELARWERGAHAIEDDELRALALEKLHDEGLHAHAAAMLATSAPAAHRADAVRAIVALELLFDYLDGLTERPLADPLRDGERLFEVYVTAAGGGRTGDEDAVDSGYLQALSRAGGDALARLPRAHAITALARAHAQRGADAQVRMHATPRLGVEQLEAWARGEADGGELEWRELLAGAGSSVLAVHALIAAAADPRTTVEHAGEIAAAYLHTCVLLTLLDGLVDHEQDALPANAGRVGYLSLYQDTDELARTLSGAAARAASRARTLRYGPHHMIALVGVVAYYASASGADSEPARALTERLRRELAPLMSPTLAFMRAWRLMWHAGDRRSRRRRH
jgi:tetraprenyl-beta-curcumene synthase